MTCEGGIGRNFHYGLDGWATRFEYLGPDEGGHLNVRAPYLIRQMPFWAYENRIEARSTNERVSF